MGLFGPKKLKKIPYDLVSYVQIEGEDVKSANDKYMIVSYAQHKLEMIDWYLELLEVGSKKYIVPQSREHLRSIKEQLFAAIKKIMDTPLPKKDDSLNVNIKYDLGEYDG